VLRQPTPAPAAAQGGKSVFGRLGGLVSGPAHSVAKGISGAVDYLATNAMCSSQGVLVNTDPTCRQHQADVDKFAAGANEALVAATAGTPAQGPVGALEASLAGAGRVSAWAAGLGRTSAGSELVISGSSRLVPGGGLAAHEAAGGHTLSRHLGLSDLALLGRLDKNPGLARASTFTDRATAERAISEVIDANASRIEAFLNGNKFTTQISGQVSGTAGRTVARGSRTPTLSSEVAVFLRRTENGNGYRITTAYPR
jgi:hypothetical protein